MQKLCAKNPVNGKSAVDNGVADGKRICCQITCNIQYAGNSHNIKSSSKHNGVATTCKCACANGGGEIETVSEICVSTNGCVIGARVVRYPGKISEVSVSVTYCVLNASLKSKEGVRITNRERT